MAYEYQCHVLRGTEHEDRLICSFQKCGLPTGLDIGDTFDLATTRGGGDPEHGHFYYARSRLEVARMYSVCRSGTCAFWESQRENEKNMTR